MANEIDERFRAHYEELLALARSRLSKERAPISTMTLAHELYLDLQGRPGLTFGSRVQFLAYASRALRSLLVDKARQRLAQKRFAELLPLTLGAEVADHAGTPEQLIALDDAIEKLGDLDERLVRIAEMRITTCMTIPEIAGALGVEASTVDREWRRARELINAALRKVP